MASNKMNQNIDNLKRWIESNRGRLIGYSDVSAIGHEAIDCALVIENVIAGIESGKLSAIELGSDFVIADFRSPFGKPLKCKIFNGLRHQADYIDSDRRSKLVDLAVKGLGLPYPPRELKALLKLIKAFGLPYCQSVIRSATPRSAVGKRYILYLGGRT